MRHRYRTVDRLIAALAAASHGVVTRAQLLDAGVTLAEIRARLRRGSLVRVFPGVYRVGHAAASREASYLAAVLACGDGALLAGRAAAHLHELVRGRAPVPDVIAPTERQVQGLRVRRSRSRSLADRDGTRVRGIPVLTVARTLVDPAGILRPEPLGVACHQAFVLHRTTPGDVEAVLARRPTAPGARRLRAIL